VNRADDTIPNENNTRLRPPPGVLRRPLCPPRHPPQSVAACLSRATGRILSRMGTKSRETIYGGSVRAGAEVIAVRSCL
jgi:hypothetical protein